MLNIAVLVSGGGTNLQALIDAQESGKIIGGKIAFVISSRADAFALQRAEKAGISTAVLIRKSFSSGEDYDNALLDLLAQHKIDLILGHTL
jgi:phosphoribosylglycinamide formyltransferase-1